MSVEGEEVGSEGVLLISNSSPSPSIPLPPPPSPLHHHLILCLRPPPPRIQAGDMLVEINGTSMVGATVDLASKRLRDSRDSVK